MDNEKLGPGWAHLFVTDSRTREEREAAESKERARRKGRGRKDWWKAKPALGAGKLPLNEGEDGHS